MKRVTRRFFLLSSAAVSAGCAGRGATNDAAPSSATSARRPVVGQSWRYAQRDLFTGALLFNQLDRVVTVDHNIVIDSNVEPPKDDNAGHSAWGSEFLRKYAGRRDKAGAALPSEIQGPWGMIQVDSHWGQVQVFEQPLPLWPAQLQSGWQARLSTNYKTPSNKDPLPWEQTMKAHAWESITVPAGHFNALRFTNLINFKSGDVTRADSVRQETLWFAPEVGRWVARESKGSYYIDDSAVDQPYEENGFRWELLDWS
jgi:hypothetical protein